MDGSGIFREVAFLKKKPEIHFGNVKFEMPTTHSTTHLWFYLWANKTLKGKRQC